MAAARVRGRGRRYPPGASATVTCPVARAAATRLSFQSWDKEAGVRVFAEGRLEGPGEGTWTWHSMEGGGAVGLREEGDDGADVIGACIAAWGD